MIGIILVSHGGIGTEMLKAVRHIFPETGHIAAVPVEQNEPPESIRRKIAETINSVTRDGGILILTDMFGGTPSNVCLSFLEPEKVEVVSGFNLPMLIKLAGIKPGASLAETASFIREYGQKNIVIASHVLAKYGGGAGEQCVS